jgi:hypothetical protein
VFVAQNGDCEYFSTYVSHLMDFKFLVFLILVVAIHLCIVRVVVVVKQMILVVIYASHHVDQVSVVRDGDCE